MPALGTLPNAPLVHVLAQIVFTRVPKMDGLFEELHQQLFSLYPESKVEHIKVFDFKEEAVSPSQETRWNILSRDARQGVVITPNTLILHTTRYTNSADFFKQLEDILVLFKAMLPEGVMVNRLGLRYVDLLLPTPTLSVNQQVINYLGIHPLRSNECKPVRLERMETFNTLIGGELRLRHTQSVNKDVLPQDLFPNVLQPAPLLNKPSANDQTDSQSVGILDFDHILSNMNDLFDPAFIVMKFRELHKVSSAVFHEVTTAHAMQIWKEKAP